MAYFNSAIFRYALENCESFKFVQNIDRPNENLVKYHRTKNTDAKFAGFKFIKKLTSITNSFSKDDQAKFEVAIYPNLKDDYTVD